MSRSYHVAVVGIGAVGFFEVNLRVAAAALSLRLAPGLCPECPSGSGRWRNVSSTADPPMKRWIRSIWRFLLGATRPTTTSACALQRRKTVNGLTNLVIIDNGNAFRQYPDVPLVVPEVSNARRCARITASSPARIAPPFRWW